MTIRKMTPDDIAAETAQVAKLETALQDAQTALAAFNEAHTFRYPQPSGAAWNTTVDRSKLANAVETTKRTLDEAKKSQHNQAIYDDILVNYAANQARIAAEKVTQEAQQRGENEAALKTQAQNVYCQHGGTALEFARSWPAMREKLLEEKTMAALRENAGVDLVEQYIRLRNQTSS